MRVLVATESSRFNDLLAVKLVTEGLEPYKVQDEEELFEFLINKEPDVLVLDFDSENFSNFETVIEIKTRYNKIEIVLITLKTGIDFVRRNMELGIFGVVSKIENFEAQANSLIQIIENVRGKRTEKRRHMRVQPDKYQTNKIRLKIPGLDSPYEGSIRDISLGGIACETRSDIPETILFKGLTTNLQVYLGMLEFSSNAKVVLKKEKIVAFYYRDLKESDRQDICEYVMSRMEHPS